MTDSEREEFNAKLEAVRERSRESSGEVKLRPGKVAVLVRVPNKLLHGQWFKWPIGVDVATGTDKTVIVEAKP